MDKQGPSMVRVAGSTLDRLGSQDDESREGLFDSERLQNHDQLLEELRGLGPKFWGIAKPPSLGEFRWIKEFGNYKETETRNDKLAQRVTLRIADLKQATRIVQYHHYLHRARTMAQLPYWIKLDNVPIGVMLFALPRLSVAVDGIRPLNLLELARFWISASVQNSTTTDSLGRIHSLAIASCAIGKAMRRVQRDWYLKYPKLPDLEAIICWADDTHHEGTIYRAANFSVAGKSGGSFHGSARRPNGGNDQLNADYTNVKTKFLYRFKRCLGPSEKRRVNAVRPARFSDLEERLYPFEPALFEEP